MATLAPDLRDHLLRGAVIPAHPLALTPERKLDERSQIALTRYYCAAGAGGIAVGVHTTQFAIHAPATGLLAPVLALASQTADRSLAAAPRPFIKVAGIVGPTRQAVAEAALAVAHGYHAGLLSLAALRDADDDALIAHATAVAAVIPVFGFYLQPAVGGRLLGYDFWRRFAAIENVVAIKIAPFNRYQTLDVLRGVADAGRGPGTADPIALYTGNDDNIVADLITDFAVGRVTTGPGDPPLQIVGGLLGQWAIWTRCAVATLAAIREQRAADRLAYRHWLAYNSQLTDANAAIFDAAHDFAGCLPGIHWILRRQGLLQSVHTLDPAEQLAPGQVATLERVCAAYPHLADDGFVAAHRDEWLR